jgi:protein TonB
MSPHGVHTILRRAARLAGVAAVLALAPTPAGADRVAPVEVMDALPQGPSVGERLAEIRQRIEAALVYPASARRRGITGVSRVRFEIAADGHPQDIELVASSGHHVLDQAARESVVGAGTLPYVHGLLQVPVHFELD